MKIVTLAVIGMLAIAGSVHAQQSNPTQPASTPTNSKPPPESQATSAPAPANPTASTPAPGLARASTAAPPGPQPPSPDLLKQARLAGYRTRVRSGVYFFCKTDADVGTRLARETCLTEDNFSELLQRVQSQRDELQHSMGCSGGGICGSSK